MLRDLVLLNIKPRAIFYKLADRDGLYVAISSAGAISFRYDYRINGRRETLNQLSSVGLHDCYWLGRPL